MPKITISYRRSDSDAVAGRIRDRLAAYYGDASLFMDIDNIPFGIDFRDHIKGALLSSDVVMVIVGPKWLGPGRGGRLRIKEESDPVRIEVETALQNGLPLIPVLVNGASMPTPADLPESLKDFAYRNAAEVETGRDFHPHMERLIRSLDRVLEAKAPGAAAAGAKAGAASGAVAAATPWRRWPLLALGATAIAAMLLLGGGLTYFLHDPAPPAPRPSATATVPSTPTTNTKTTTPPPVTAGCSSETAVPGLDPTAIPEPGPALRDALTTAITALFRCATIPFDQLARTFATVSVVIPSYVTDAACFRNNTAVVTGNWADHKGWADKQGREDLLWVNLHQKITSALGCIEPAQQRNFFVDVANAFAAGTAKADTQTFVNPTLRGQRVDRCLYYARECNGPAALAWCQRFGFSR